MNLEETGAIVCAHVAHRGAAIKRAVRGRPVVPEDSGWQFLCGDESHEDVAQAELWLVSEVLTIEPSLASIIDSDPGTTFVRGDTGDWVIEANP